MFLASENIDFTGLSHVFLLGGGEGCPLFTWENRHCGDVVSNVGAIIGRPIRRDGR